jgi:hypothetical protein
MYGRIGITSGQNEQQYKGYEEFSHYLPGKITNIEQKNNAEN